ISNEAQMEIYGAAPSEIWGEHVDPERRQYDRIFAQAERLSRGRKILDVGCWTGTMLEFFGADWERFAVEPSAEAAKHAAGRGIVVLGKRLEDLPGEQQFHVITAIDVVEHVAEPVTFFKAI